MPTYLAMLISKTHGFHQPALVVHKMSVKIKWQPKRRRKMVCGWYMEFWGTASAQYVGAGAGFPNYAYGGRFCFVQTGQVAGFLF